jgi:hypothetical protein
MSDPEATGAQPPAPAAPAASAPAPAKPAAAPAAPPRPLPTEEDIGHWAEGDEVPLVGALFDTLDLAKFDLLTDKVRKEEHLPQHWQVLRALQPPPEEEFDRLPEVARLASRYRDPELGRQRVEALRHAWRELRGKRPALFEVADFFAAWRRILQHKRPVGAYDLLTAMRDVWADLTLPRGQEQRLLMWNCLVQVRRMTKK